ncbi:MAG: hypothetical protein V4475_06495, partial [Pseudomonadota bacterium]
CAASRPSSSWPTPSSANLAANGTQTVTPAQLGAVVAAAKQAGRDQVALLVVRAKSPPVFVGIKLRK